MVKEISSNDPRFGNILQELDTEIAIETDSRCFFRSVGRNGRIICGWKSLGTKMDNKLLTLISHPHCYVF